MQILLCYSSEFSGGDKVPHEEKKMMREREVEEGDEEKLEKEMIETRFWKHKCANLKWS